MPTIEIDRTERAVKAGKQLREMRLARGWTAMNIEEKTRRQFGEGAEINETQNGRIENGNIKRMSFEDAMKLAWVYGISPQEMAVICGLWPESDDAKMPKEIRMALLMADTLPDDERQSFLFGIDYETKKKRAWLKQRERGLVHPTTASDWGKYRSSEDE